MMMASQTSGTILLPSRPRLARLVLTMIGLAGCSMLLLIMIWRRLVLARLGLCGLQHIMLHPMGLQRSLADWSSGCWRTRSWGTPRLRWDLLQMACLWTVADMIKRKYQSRHANWQRHRRQLHGRCVMLLT
jgi:hypothetical protein